MVDIQLSPEAYYAWTLLILAASVCAVGFFVFVAGAAWLDRRGDIVWRSLVLALMLLITWMPFPLYFVCQAYARLAEARGW